MKVKKHMLVILNVMQSDSGNYTCMVRNAGGIIRRTFILGDTTAAPTAHTHTIPPTSMGITSLYTIIYNFTPY